MACSSPILLTIFVLIVARQADVAENAPISNVSMPQSESKLRLVHAVFRHGDRFPWKTFPTDANQEPAWPGGLGELTEVGEEQSFQLGKLLRRRYSNHLDMEYSPHELYLRSTDYTRTLSSAAALAAGLYAKLNVAKLTDLTSWRPIPIHTVPQDTDSLLRGDAVCPVAEAELDRVQNSAEVLQIMTNSGAILNYLREHSGKELRRLDDISDVSDPLFCESKHNATNPLPAWVNESVLQQTQMLFHLSTRYSFSTPLLKRLRGGLLLQEVTSRMQGFVDDTIDRRLKFHGYSAHDTTLTPLLEALQVYDGFNPPYASLVLIELHQDDYERYFVKILYKNSTENPALHELQVPDCGTPCYLETFSDLLKPIFPEDWAAECRLEPENDEINVAVDEETTIIITRDTAIIIIVVVVVSIILISFLQMVALMKLQLILKRRLNSMFGPGSAGSSKLASSKESEIMSHTLQLS